MVCLISYAKNLGVLTLHAYWNFAWEILNDAFSSLLLLLLLLVNAKMEPYTMKLVHGVLWNFWKLTLRPLQKILIVSKQVCCK